MDWEPNLDDYKGKIFRTLDVGAARRANYNFALECRKSFKWCCENSIRIINKENQRVFMKLNNAQNKLYQKCKEQMEKNNQILLVIIKGNLYLLPCHDSLEAVLLSSNNWSHCFTA